MCWSSRGMSGHKSARPPKGMFYPSSAGTLTCVKLLVPCPSNRNSGLLSFVLVRMIMPSSLCIKSPNQPSLITSLKSCNLITVRNSTKAPTRSII
jgi:hypothetical protein